MKKITGGKIILEDKILEGYGIVFDEKIIKIDKVENLKDIICEEVKTSSYISPGFIDTHIHGSGGYDVMDEDEKALDCIARTLVQSGTTSFYPTTMTMNQSTITASLDRIRNYIHKNETSGANVLGVHLEGPFISAVYKGAQDETFIQKPNDNWIKEYYDIVKIVTLAPEEDEDFSLTKELKEHNIIVSMGHTNIDYDTAKKAYEAGVSHVTHLFNAMSKFHHREPGAVGAALTLPFTVEMITDKIHFHPSLFEFVSKTKGIDHVTLITDAIRGAFLPEGESELGGQKVVISNGACRLSDGTLAGSIHRMDQALKNMMEETNLKLYEVVKMLTANPARIMNIDDKKGHLKEGFDADIVIFNNNYEIENVFISGKEAF